MGSIEGRVAVHHVEDNLQSKNFTFKCHRWVTPPPPPLLALRCWCCCAVPLLPPPAPPLQVLPLPLPRHQFTHPSPTMRSDGNDVYAVNNMSFHPQFGTFVTAVRAPTCPWLRCWFWGSAPGVVVLWLRRGHLHMQRATIPHIVRPVRRCPYRRRCCLLQGSDGAYNFWDKDSKQRLKAMAKCSMPIPCGDFNRCVCGCKWGSAALL